MLGLERLRQLCTTILGAGAIGAAGSQMMKYASKQKYSETEQRYSKTEMPAVDNSIKETIEDEADYDDDDSGIMDAELYDDGIDGDVDDDDHSGIMDAVLYGDETDVFNDIINGKEATDDELITRYDSDEIKPMESRMLSSRKKGPIPADELFDTNKILPVIDVTRGPFSKKRWKNDIKRKRKAIRKRYRYKDP